MKARRGFTLIEMLMVLFIIGLITGFALFSMNIFKSGNDLESTTQTLTARLRLAQMEAIFEQERMGVAIDQTGYRFYRFDKERQNWILLDDDNLFKHQNLPKKVNLSVTVNEAKQPLSRTLPQIILEQGQASRFTLLFSDEKNNTFTVSSNERGEIVWDAS